MTPAPLVRPPQPGSVAAVYLLGLGRRLQLGEFTSAQWLALRFHSSFCVCEQLAASQCVYSMSIIHTFAKSPGKWSVSLLAKVTELLAGGLCIVSARRLHSECAETSHRHVTRRSERPRDAASRRKRMDVSWTFLALIIWYRAAKLIGVIPT
jgi:hypothetical protein